MENDVGRLFFDGESRWMFIIGAPGFEEWEQCFMTFNLGVEANPFRDYHHEVFNQWLKEQNHRGWLEVKP